MTKTIHKMAVEDAKYWCSTPGSEGTKEELVTIGYMRGANAVIEEIDQFIFDEIQMKDITNGHMILHIIRKKFRELKGK